MEGLLAPDFADSLLHILVELVVNESVHNLPALCIVCKDFELVSMLSDVN